MNRLLLACFLFVVHFAKTQHVQGEFNPLISRENSKIADAAVCPDGSVVIAGDIAVIDGIPVPGFAKLMPDGSLDQSFKVGKAFNGEIRNVSFANGKIIVGGNFTMYNDTVARNIVRLNADGSIDNSLQTGAGIKGKLYDIHVQSDGKIIVAGKFSEYDQNDVNHIFRINKDGSIDHSFTPGLSIKSGYIFTLGIQSDGEILLGGSFRMEKGSAYLVRLNEDGSLDTSFNSEGEGPDWSVHDIDFQVIDQEQHILICGLFHQYNGVESGRAVRLKSDGKMDDTFNSSALTSSSLFTKIFSHFDNIYTVGGGVLYRFSNSGIEDETFKKLYIQASWIDKTVDGDLLMNGTMRISWAARRRSHAGAHVPGPLHHRPAG